MQPEHFYFGGGNLGTVMHPAVAAAMVLAIILILDAAAIKGRHIYSWPRFDSIGPDIGAGAGCTFSF